MAGSKIGFWHAIRDVVIASINKGQAPVVLVALTVLVIATRLPPESLGRVTEKIVENFENTHLVGWTLAIFLIFAWALHARRMRQKFHQEIDRVTKERNSLQNAQAGQGKVKSSRRKK